MNNIISLATAFENYSALTAESPAETVSDKYRFISTKQILERLDQLGWGITWVRQANDAATAAHFIELVSPDTRERIVSGAALEQEGFPTIVLFNSHNRSRRFGTVLGYRRLTTGDRILTTIGSRTDAVRQVHRFSDERLEQLETRVSDMIEHIPAIEGAINSFRNRELSPLEKRAFAQFAADVRFIYRTATPKKFNIDPLLVPRNEIDNNNTLWSTFNTVQGNLYTGMSGVSRPINGYLDDSRVRQELWRACKVAANFTGEDLVKQFEKMLELRRKNKKAPAEEVVSAE